VRREQRLKGASLDRRINTYAVKYIPCGPDDTCGSVRQRFCEILYTVKIVTIN
jgi:hypothetical protein